MKYDIKDIDRNTKEDFDEEKEMVPYYDIGYP